MRARIQAPFEDIIFHFQDLVFADNFCATVSTNDLAGTWTGSLDCAGSSGQLEVSPSDTTTVAILNLTDVGVVGINNYDADLDGTSLCASIASNPDDPASGEGQLVDPHTLETQAYLKYDGDTMKLRGVTSDGGMGKIELCKGDFVRTSITPPVVAEACVDRAACQNNCSCNTLCGVGPGPGGHLLNCFCKDGFQGDPIVSTCTAIP